MFDSYFSAPDYFVSVAHCQSFLTFHISNISEIYERLRSTSSLKSMSNFYVTDICTSDLCLFVKFSNWRPIIKSMSFFNSQILKSMAISHFLISTSNDVTDICPSPNPNQ